MLSHILYYFLEGFSVCGAAFALWKGGAAERLAAGVIIVNVVIGNLDLLITSHVEPLVHLSNDGLAAVALLIITLRFGALWLGGVMLFYAAQFSLQSYYLVTERAQDHVYAWINNINWQGVIWSLIIATAFAWRERLKAGAAPAEFIAADGVQPALQA